jgi:CRISPR-associated protein Cas1
MSPRAATNPAQAILNFCYALLESQTRQALNAVGADVSVGVLHADQDGRDSLVYDVMESLRGEVDDLFLSFLGEHTFGAGDFQAMTTGQLTIHPSLCRVLVQLVRVPQKRADDEARWFRAQLVDMSERADRRRPRRLGGRSGNDSGSNAKDDNDDSEK